MTEQFTIRRETLEDSRGNQAQNIYIKTGDSSFRCGAYVGPVDPANYYEIRAARIVRAWNALDGLIDGLENALPDALEKLESMRHDIKAGHYTQADYDQKHAEIVDAEAALKVAKHS